MLLGAMNIILPLIQQAIRPVESGILGQVRSSRQRRRGLGPASNPQQTLTNMLRINPALPSRFMRPYRTPGGAFLSAPTAGGQSTEPARETDVTLLRADPDATSRPLFEMDDYLMHDNQHVHMGLKATPDTFPLACMDFNRNPYFRYQLMQKLGSVVSNHSNVFAVWITEGYFEVTPVAERRTPGTPTAINWARSWAATRGDIVRHRAFYIFDRSIPVGFIRGQDINHDKATLLKRFIE